MLDGLIAGDGATEGVAPHGVLPRHFQRRLGSAHLFPGEKHCGTVEQALGMLPAFPGSAQGFGFRVRQLEPGVRAGGIERGERISFHAARFHQMQRRAIAIVTRCHHHGKVGNVAIRHRHLRAGEASVRCAGGESVGAGLAGALAQGKCADGLSSRQLRQPALLLRVAAGSQQRFGGEIDGGRERNRCHGPAEFLGNDAKLEIGKPEAPEAFRDDRRGPSHLGDLLPEVGVIGRIAIENGANGAWRAVVPQECLRLIAQEVLFIGEFKVHGLLPFLGLTQLYPGVAGILRRLRLRHGAEAAALRFGHRAKDRQASERLR